MNEPEFECIFPNEECGSLCELYDSCPIVVEIEEEGMESEEVDGEYEGGIG